MFKLTNIGKMFYKNRMMIGNGITISSLEFKKPNGNTVYMSFPTDMHTMLQWGHLMNGNALYGMGVSNRAIVDEDYGYIKQSNITISTVSRAVENGSLVCRYMLTNGTANPVDATGLFWVGIVQCSPNVGSQTFQSDGYALLAYDNFDETLTIQPNEAYRVDIKYTPQGIVTEVTPNP